MVAVLCERAPITPILPPFPIPLLLTTHSPPHSHSKPSCIQSSIYPWLPACKGIKARSRPTCKCMLLDRSSWKSPSFRTKETEKILKILTNRRSTSSTFLFLSVLVDRTRKTAVRWETKYDWPKYEFNTRSNFTHVRIFLFVGTR